MKKNLFQLMAILMVAMLCVGFVSCGSDDEDDHGGGSGTEASALIGTWTREYYTGDGTKAKETFTFKNGSGSYSNAYQSATFTYTAANGYIAVKIRYSDSSTTIDDLWSYNIEGKTLYLNGNKYSKQ